jgi:hypothetical protein
MKISHVGRSLFHTPDRNLVLDKILHVPQANKSLASVHRLASDNNIFFEFYPDYFLIKDWDTQTVLHQGRCRGGLYPFTSTSTSNKAIHSVAKVS